MKIMWIIIIQTIKSMPMFVWWTSYHSYLLCVGVLHGQPRLPEFHHIMGIVIAFRVIKENNYKFPVPLLLDIFYTSATRRIRASSLVSPILYESYRFIQSSFFLVHKNRIKIYACCTHTNISILYYYILLYSQRNKSLVYRTHNKIYDCDNGGFVDTQGYTATQPYRHGTQITKRTKKRIRLK